MSEHRVIFEENGFRILEIPDHDTDMDNLKGDCFNFERSGFTGTREELRREEREFEDLVRCEGVFGYVLEKWNPAVGAGWEHVDSCFGFIGQFSNEPKFNHYIVAELIATAKKEIL